MPVEIEILQCPAALRYFLLNTEASLMQLAKIGVRQILESWLF